MTESRGLYRLLAQAAATVVAIGGLVLPAQTAFAAPLLQGTVASTMATYGSADPCEIYKDDAAQYKLCKQRQRKPI